MSTLRQNHKTQVRGHMDGNVPDWRRELRERCERLGWNVPQIPNLPGYRLFQLNQLVLEEEIARKIIHLHPESVGAMRIDLTSRTPFERQSQAEEMSESSEFDR